MTNNADDEDDVMVGFAELEFNPEEDNVKDHDIMSDKHFKILNSKLNSILQFIHNSVRMSSVSGQEVKYLLKSQEARTNTLVDGVDK